MNATRFVLTQCAPLRETISTPLHITAGPSAQILAEAAWLGDTAVYIPAGSPAEVLIVFIEPTDTDVYEQVGIWAQVAIDTRSLLVVYPANKDEEDRVTLLCENGATKRSVAEISEILRAIIGALAVA